MKVFLDTNVLVSAYATRGLCADVLRLVLAEHELITSEVVLEELERILAYKIKLSPEVVGQTLAFLRQHPVQPRPDSVENLHVSDPDDAWVLASALAAKADVLITGDPHLLEAMLPVREPAILKPREFWELHRNSAG